MATPQNQGIMALPENQGMQAPQLSLTDSYDAMQQGLQTARPDAAMELEEALAQIRPELDELTDEQLGQLIEAIQGLYGDPENYAKEVADLVKEDLIDEGDLPPEYDEEFLSALLMVLVDVQRSRMATSGSEQPMPEAPMDMMPMGMMPPQGFARGGIAEAARMVANSGRYGDTMLAHITPSEARLLKSRGGSGTINPETGLPEFFFKKIFKAIKDTFKRVVNVVKTVLKSPVGRVLGTIALGMVMGPAVMTMFPSLAATVGGVTSLTAMGSAVTGALTSGTVAALSGGDLKSVLTSAATGFLGAPGGPVGNYINKYTSAVVGTNAAANAALTGAIVGTGTGLVSGQNLKDSIKSGLTEGIISGGTAFFSGAPKVDVDNAAATAAKDAVENVNQRAGVDLDPDSAIVGSNTRPLNKETALRTTVYRNGAVKEAVVDIGTGNVISEGLTAGPGSKAVSPPPAYKGTEIPTDIFAQKPGMSPSQYAGQQLDAAKKGVFAQKPGMSPSEFASQQLDAAKEGIFTQKPGMSPSAFESQRLATAKEGIFAPRSGTVDMEYSSANLPPQAAPTAAAEASKAYVYPELGASLKKATTPGTIMEGLGDLFMPSAPTMDQVLESPQYKNLIDKGFSPEAALKQATNSMSPGMLRTYGPGVAAGIAGLGMMGGFAPKPPPQSEFANQMRQPIDLSGDPSRYYVQGLPGVQYDERGTIIGSTPWSAPQTMNDIRVAGRSYVGFNPMSYQQQQYQPMFMNMGGIAALAQGGYPRRNGQISGPGTEKSDSIPAMLSDGEFVMTAKAVRGAGGGSRREGAKRMYALMNQLERNAARG